MAPSLPSRPAVHVVLRTSTSISPDWSAVNRASVARSTNSTASASPRIAAAITRQKSASKPTWSPPGVEHREAGKRVAGATAQRAALLDVLEQAGALLAGVVSVVVAACGDGCE